MSDLNQKLAVMVKEADLRKRGVMDSCPVTEEWLKHRYKMESSGESFEAWLTIVAIRLSKTIYQLHADEGLSAADAETSLADAFPSMDSGHV